MGLEQGDTGIVDAGGDEAIITAEGQLTTEPRLRGTVSTANSSTATLGSSGVFTGTAEDVTDYAIAYVTVFADQTSATDGLSVQQSSDGTNWDFTDVFTIPANSGRTFSFELAAQYFRVVYTNGAAAQGAFRLQTVFKQVYGKPSTVRIQDTISVDADAELVKSIASGRDTNGTFRTLATTTTGALKVSLTPVAVTEIISGALSDGSTTNMVVDGSGTPVNFTFDADPTDDLVLNELRVVFVPNVLRVDGSSFGSLSGPLTNGVRFAITADGTETVIATLQKTEDVLALASTSVATETGLPANDLLFLVVDLGGITLVGGSSDKVEFRIQDDLAPPGPNSIASFIATVTAFKTA